MSQVDNQQLYLSLVLTGRNDNYGGDFKSRLQRSISNSFKQLEELKIPSEIIFVNYNPVDDNPPIEDFIDWPSSTETVKIRVITIPNSIHKKLVEDGSRNDVPVLEYLGKNAGIRRARGEYILSMNPDIVLPKELVKELSNLNKHSYYRTDRVDFEGDMDGEHHLSRIFLKGHDYPISSLDEIPALRKKNGFQNIWKRFTPRISWILNRFSKPVFYNHVSNRYHCNVSGDFMLMHRDRWFEMEAHNENTPISLHVDALMVMQAASSDLREVVFENPIFHHEHTRRYDATKENPVFLKAFEWFTAEAREMIHQKSPKKYNGQHWGLSKFDLPELNL